MPAFMPEAKEAAAGRGSLPTTASLLRSRGQQTCKDLPLVAIPGSRQLIAGKASCRVSRKDVMEADGIFRLPLFMAMFLWLEPGIAGRCERPGYRCGRKTGTENRAFRRRKRKA